MKRIFTLLLCFIVAFFESYAQNCVNSGDALSGVSGWGACTSMGASAGGTTIFTTNATASGDRYFRFYGDGSPCGEYGPSGGSDVQLTIGTVQTLTCGGSKAYFINTANTSNRYIFKGGGNGTSNPNEGKAVVFEVQGTVQSVSSTTRTPSGTVNANVGVTVTSTLSSAFATGQAAFLRYTKDNFATSTIVKMTGSGTSYSASIPASFNTVSSVVKYYVFTSGDVASVASSDADLFTINLDNNGGSNYTYTVDIALSANLTSFKGNTAKGQNILDWSTASEKNAAHFDIQRSSDNTAWSSISQVKAVNNAYGSDYQFIDAQPLSGTNYYRLQMVDANGSTELSKIVAVNASTGNKSLKIYPNPAKDVLTILTDANTEGVSIFDINGRLVLSVVDKSQNVNIQKLASGVYFVRMMDKTGFVGSPVRFVKQ